MPLGYQEPPEKRRPMHGDAEEARPTEIPRPIDTRRAVKRGARLRESGFFKLIEDVTRKSREPRYTDPEDKYWRYRAKPLWITVGFGLLAVLLIIGPIWLPEISAPLGVPAGSIGWVRFILFILGAYCAFIAWPRRHSVCDKPGEPRRPRPRLKTRR